MNNKTGEIWKTQATDGAEYSVVILKDHGVVFCNVCSFIQILGNPYDPEVGTVAGVLALCDLVSVSGFFFDLRRFGCGGAFSLCGGVAYDFFTIGDQPDVFCKGENDHLKEGKEL